MNAVQFGRWFSERRRAGGWPSQRLLAEAALHHSILELAGISEDFLSRLEAGHLAHPFRGTVRRRMLLLAWLLCKTPRDLKSYLKAAGLNDTSEEENAQLHLLSEHLASLQTPPPLLLPARPAHLQGRAEDLALILAALSSVETRVFALTGMPGVGKSALAHEVLHRLAAAESERLRHFPDGIATFTCIGRQGTRGLISLLNEITELFTGALHNGLRTARKRGSNSAGELTPEYLEVEPELASVIDRTRAALANKRVLLLLDDLDPAFPLRQALDVLLAQGAQTLHDTKIETLHEQRVILTTSQFVPAPALISNRLHIQPLSEEAALNLLTELVGEEMSELDLIYARRACAAVGYLPLAIEGMATAVQVNSIPLALVAAHLTEHPLGGLLGNKEEAAASMEKALTGLERNMHADYLLLAALELPTFDLETAAAILSPQRLPLPEISRALPETARPARPEKICQHAAVLARHDISTLDNEHLACLAGTAAILGQFVRSSLLDICSPDLISTADSQIQPGSQVCYRMHRLLYACARNMVHTLPEKCLELARHNLLSHALTRALSGGVRLPEQEQADILASIAQARRENQPETITRLARELLPLETSV